MSDDGDAGKPGKAEGATTGVARAWAAVAFWVVSVVAVAGLLFTARREQRAEEITAHFSRTAAHAAEAVEHRHDNYRQVVDNSTRKASDAGRGPVGKLRVEGAKARLESAATVKEYAGARLDLARKRVSEAEGLGTGTEVAARIEATVARAAAREAEQYGKIALEEAERAEKAARVAVEAATTPEPTEPSAADDAKKKALDAARRAVDAQAAADGAMAKAEETLGKAESAQPGSAGDFQVKGGPAGNGDAWYRAALALSAQADDQIAAQIQKLEGSLLPSYRPIVRSCLGKGERSQVELCVAREIARNSDTEAQGLEFVACPSGSGKASRAALLAPDGRFLYLPPRNAGESLAACGRVSVDRLLSGAAAGASPEQDRRRANAFDEVLLLDRKGRVIHRTASDPGLRIVALPGFEPKHLAASSVMGDVTIGAEKFRAFLQPIAERRIERLGEPGKAGSSGKGDDGAEEHDGAAPDLVVCGLVRDKRVVEYSLEVTPASFLWAVLLAGLGLLSLPLAKLWFLGQKARFGRFDVALLVTSAVTATLLFVVLGLTFGASNQLRKRLDDQLAHVGSSLVDRFSRELDESGKALDALVQQSDPLQRALSSTEGAPSVEEACEGDVARAAFAGSDRELSVCEKTNHRMMPTADGGDDAHWDLAFLTNGRGYQQAKFATKDHATNPISVAGRTYFRRAMEGPHSQGAPRSDCDTTPVPEVVRSDTSGGMFLVLSRAFCKGKTGTEATGTAAIGSRLRAFERPVLPARFQMIVVDSDGRVMLHSDNETHHRHDVFEDVDDAAALRGILEGGKPRAMELRYLGALSKAHVQPLPRTDWSVLVVAPRELIDVPAANATLIALFAFALLAVFTLLLLLVVPAAGALAGRTGNVRRVLHSHWLRPDDRYRRAYVTAGGWMVVVTALCSALALALPGTGTLLWVPLWFVLAGYLVRRFRAAPVEDAAAITRPAGFRHSVAFAYSLYCFGLAGMCIVVPASVLFAGAYHETAHGLVAAEHRHVIRELGGRTSCVTTLTGRDRECPHVFGSGRETAVPREQRAEPPSWLSSCWVSPVACAGEWLPKVEVRAPVLPENGAASSGTRGRQDPTWTQARALTALELVPRDPGSAVVQTAVPRLVGTNYDVPGAILLALVLLAVILAAYLVAHYSMRRLLFLDRLDEEATRTPATPDGVLERVTRPPRKVLVIGAGAAFTGELGTRCEPFPDAPGGAPPALPWLLANLEPLLASSEAVKRVAEVLAAGNHPVIVASPVDPLRRAPPELRAGWARALADFDVVQAPPLADPLAAGGADPSDARMGVVWADSDPDERRALAQLAIDGYANPHPSNVPTMKHLWLRGLIGRHTFTLDDGHLAAFIRRTISGAELHAWESSDGRSAWGSLRMPLYAGVGILLVLLGVSQPELAAAGAIGPALAAMLPAVFRALMSLAGPGQGSG